MATVIRLFSKYAEIIPKINPTTVTMRFPEPKTKAVMALRTAYGM